MIDIIKKPSDQRRALFISSGIFPEGQASSIRETLLARGVVKKGRGVDFVVLNPQQWTKKNISYNGVAYKTYFLQGAGSDRFRRVKNLMATLFLLVKIFRTRNRIDFVFLFPVTWVYFSAITLFCKLLCLPIVTEKTESYCRVFKWDPVQPIKSIKLIFTSQILRFFTRFHDHNFAISNALVSEIKSQCRSVSKLPTIVDYGFFDTATKDKSAKLSYICYAGVFSEEQNGVVTIVKSFELVRRRFPSLRLVLCGREVGPDLSSIKALVRSENLDGFVDFYGHIEREDMPSLFKNARLLLLAKPDNEMNRKNFPIKLGEYLSSGVPVVATSVGEIPLYLQDGQNSYLAESSDVEKYAEKIIEALSFPDRLKSVGLAGSAVAKQFDYVCVAGDCLAAIDEVLERRGKNYH